tara:strand:+ start:2011 stop:3600 length:1590 start_codon:yes stop_codon:yes gene_type:complete
MFKAQNKNLFHFIFLLILSLNYIVPYFLFGNITLFYHDALDSEIIYNKIIGKYYSGDTDAINLLLNGEIKFEFLRRIYQPIIILYTIFETELAYWLTDIFVKLTSYIAFFTLTKKFTKNIFICCLASCLFATLNVATHYGLGIAIFPYLIYLALFKTKIKIKHIFTIIFFGLNSDLILTIFTFPFLIAAVLIISPQTFKLFNFNNIKILIIFFISILIGNFNLILLGFSDQVFHREEFYKEALHPSDYFIAFFSQLFNYVNEINFNFFNQFPEFFLLLFLFPLTIFLKQKKAKNIFFLILFVEIFLFFLRTDFYLNFYNNSDGLFSSLNFGYCSTILPLLYCLLSILILKIERKNISNFFQFVVLISIFLGQINSSVVPFYKKFILNENNYRNIYTFKEYYLYDDYKKFNAIIDDKRSLSLGIDPMIAIANNLATIDGYHNIYPLEYKKKFRLIIEKELQKNTKLKKYYDNWGSRVYGFISDPNNIEINFKQAKNLGADYVISAYNLDNENLMLVCDNCSDFLKLYFIQ